MIIKNTDILSLKIVILSLPFIFGIIAQAWADSVKSINDAANQETIMKMDENKGVIQKKKGPAKRPIRSSKNRNIRFYKGISYSQHKYAKLEIQKITQKAEKIRFISPDH